jgi:S-adenosylmethionine-diacylglycerol 3-amino-3-carboxypropyl transferase
MTYDKLLRRAVFDDVLYSQCWEDPSIDREAFNISPDDVLFTITSGGCNALAFLLDNPRRVISLDINASQNRLLELKAAALSKLSYGELLAFIGVHPSGGRDTAYRRLRHSLSEVTRAFWDRRPREISKGIIHCGRFEHYVRLLGALTRTIVGEDVVHRMFCAHSPDERRRIYERFWDTPAWRMLTRLLMSRRFMSFVFDGAFFAQLEENFSFGRHFEERIRHALIELPPRRSPFLSYALLGTFSEPDSLPLYLHEDNVPLIRNRIDRLNSIDGDCATYFRSCSASTISRFNFTNIFEWMPTDACTELLRDTVRVATDGAVLTYRNLLVRRSCPASLEKSIFPRSGQAASLHERDLSFLYRAYVIEVIHKQRESYGSQRDSSIHPV